MAWEGKPVKVFKADARHLPFAENSVDLVFTSPPYWKKRDYGLANQIGQEGSPERYVETLIECLRDWRRVLRPTGSIFLNIGDTYDKGCLAGIPGLLQSAARKNGWTIRNRIVWAKSQGMPSPVKNRLVSRHEFVLHLVQSKDYYYDLHGYSRFLGENGNPGDVWDIDVKPSQKSHLAPFPEKLVRRAVVAACPKQVCSECGEPRRRILQRTKKLDPNRPQARRAMEIYEESDELTEEHIEAIQATGISDAGKAREFQNGTGRNAERVQKLAKEAKEILGGYFREFTFAKKETAGYTDCECSAAHHPGVVLDPFSGSGTTLKVAAELNRRALGTDLEPVEVKPEQIQQIALASEDQVAVS